MSKETKPKPRLGRGLSSLISMSETTILEVPPPAPAVRDVPASASPAAAPAAATDLPIANIRPNPAQPRRDFDQAALAELAASIKAAGIIQPIIVRQVAGGYELIAGERRLQAAKLAGLTTIPAVVRTVDSASQAQMALIENIQRKDLNPIERAAGYKAIIQLLGLTQAELAQRMGEDRSSVANFLRLLELPEAVRQMIFDGRLSFGHAKLLAGRPDPVEQERLANLVLTQGLSVRNLERMVQNAPLPVPAGREAGGTTPHIQDLEKVISGQLGMRVQVRTSGGKGRGRIVIHYANLDQFDDLMTRMGVKTD
jgi:ParB family transcriptional regulator, chromosome partitioning protein